ncbi:MAG: MarR family transcriptional regulator [Chloroflexi bacterium]|nr:MarR family transcriptional regulator [Chloroflexota bacterium]
MDKWEASFEERFFSLLTRIYRLLQHHADHNMPADACSPQQLGFLRRLQEAGAPQPMSFFADGVISSRSNATQMIDRLQSEGLVSRVRHPLDRRSVLVELTDLGAQRLADGHARLEAMAKELFAPLSQSERENVIEVFEIVLALLERQAAAAED